MGSRKLWEELKPIPPAEEKTLEVTGSYTDEAEGDHQALRQIAGAGSDLAKPRHTIFFLYFPTAASAEAAVPELWDVGYAAGALARLSLDVENPWPVSAEMMCVLDESSIIEHRDRLRAHAERFGGAYDGWEAALDE